ncbi:MAG: preprotein translocase subunit SecE [Nevskia sp.]|nr:preprotein translocase subunit SecE [Nevskia sp.]
MELQSEETGSRYDTPLLTAALLLLLGGMVAFYYFDPQLGKLPRLAMLLGGVAGCGFLVSRTALGEAIWSYLQGANVERRKVVWPTRQESVQTTLVIAIFVVIVALLMWGLDSLLLFGVQHLTGRSA